MRTVTVIAVVFRRPNLWSGAQSGARLTTRRLSSTVKKLLALENDVDVCL